MKKDYEKYLRSPHWRSFRQRYKEERPWSCVHPGCKAKRLDLHHLTYARVGRESLDDVVPICRLHHNATHRLVALGVPLAVAHLQIEKKVVKLEPTKKAHTKKPKTKRKPGKWRGKQALAAKPKAYSEVRRLVLEPRPPSDLPSGSTIIERELAARAKRAELRRRNRRERI